MHTKLLPCLLFVFALAVGPITSAAKLYKWVDKDGKVHYSDKLPPESAKQAHEELNEMGVTIKQERSVQEVEEQTQLDQAELEAHRKAQSEAAKQRRHDQILLDTFTTERDLLLTRNERIGMIDSIINLTKNNNERLSEQIQQTRNQITSIEKNGREVPENIIKKLQGLEIQLEKNLEFIENRKQERQRLDTQFEQDLARFKELKNEEAGGSLEPQLESRLAQ